MKNLNKETNKVVSYKITYKDFENNVKECIWSLRDFDVKQLTPQRLSDIEHYISTGEWIKRRGYRKKKWLSCGVSTSRTGVTCVAQDIYYRVIASEVDHDIAKDCVKDHAFAKRLLKQATKLAKERDARLLDQIDEELAEEYRDVNRKILTSVKRDITKYLKRTSTHKAAYGYAAVVGDYEMYKILKMEPYEGEPRYFIDWMREVMDVGEQMRQEYYAMLLKKEDESKLA